MPRTGGHRDRICRILIMPPDANELQICHNAERQQFEAQLAGELAVLTYTIHGKEVSLNHTYVPDAFRGRGVAARLVEAAIDEARRNHWKVRPACSYAVTFFERHPECSDLVA